MFANYSLLFIVFIINKIIPILSDCGFPALPVHMKVRPFINTYFEDDVIQYYCEYDDMILIGNDKRQCSQSKWKGDIPHCVREIKRRSLSRIEAIDIKNHTISSTMNNILIYYNPSLMKANKIYEEKTYYGDYDKNPKECIHSKTTANVSKLEWRVVFKKAIAQVYSVQIVIPSQEMGYKIDLQKTESVIKGVFVSDYRKCEPQKVETVDMANKLFRYSFHCEIFDKDMNQNIEDMNKLRFESLTNITIYFATNEVTVCELHISQTIPFRSYTSGSCGSPDVPLFSNYTPVQDQTTKSPIPVGYSFACDEGFHLDGNPIVLCGINNKWADPFPTCLPNNPCPLMDQTRLNELDLSVNYRNLYSFDGNISAVNSTQAIYSCATKDKDNKNTFNKTLIGDSIRFCEINGKWSGEEPMCIDVNDFSLYLAELNEDILQTDSKLPKFAQHLHQVDQCSLPAIPQFAKVYTYDKELLNIYIASIIERIDLMPNYPNGSVITYHCESKFTYMASDFDSRTCINGSWVGEFGKCFNPIGGTDISRAASVQVMYDQSVKQGYPEQTYHNVFNTSFTDDYWSYYEKDHTKCVPLDMTKGTKITMTIYLQMPVKVSYFVIRMGAKSIFHELEDKSFKVKRASQLNSNPITAEIAHIYYGQTSECIVTKVIETGDYDNFGGITLVSFKCDETDFQNNKKKFKIQGYEYDNTKTNTITIHLNPDQFHQNFNATNIKFCGIMIFESSNGCGTPEIIPNSEIMPDLKNNYVRYRCKPGYRLVGSEFVRCSEFGSWKDQFPRCELYSLCNMTKTKPKEVLQRKYYNTLVIDNTEVAVLGTIVEYRCKFENIDQGLHIRIGPRTAVCTESGQWSVNEPICGDDKYFIRASEVKQEHKHSMAALLWISAILIILVIVISLFIIYRRYGCSNPFISVITRRKATRSSDSFIDYKQSNFRDSVMSFNAGISSINSHSTA